MTRVKTHAASTAAALLLTTALAGWPAYAQQGANTPAPPNPPQAAAPQNRPVPPAPPPGQGPGAPGQGHAGGLNSAQQNPGQPNPAQAGMAQAPGQPGISSSGSASGNADTSRPGANAQARGNERPGRERRWYEEDADRGQSANEGERGEHDAAGRLGRNEGGGDWRSEERGGRGGRYGGGWRDRAAGGYAERGHDEESGARDDRGTGPMMGARMLMRLCGPGGDRMIGRMLDRLERATDPNDAQRAAFDRLVDASERARNIVRDSCSNERTITLPGRLAQAEKRVGALLDAIRTVRPALDDFYNSLSEEQKARLYMGAHSRNQDFEDHAGRRERSWRDEPLHERWRDRGREDDFGPYNRSYRHGDGAGRDRWEDEDEGRYAPDERRDYGGDRDRWRGEDRRDNDRYGWPREWRGPS